MCYSWESALANNGGVSNWQDGGSAITVLQYGASSNGNLTLTAAVTFPPDTTTMPADLLRAQMQTRFASIFTGFEAWYAQYQPSYVASTAPLLVCVNCLPPTVPPAPAALVPPPRSTPPPGALAPPPGEPQPVPSWPPPPLTTALQPTAVPPATALQQLSAPHMTFSWTFLGITQAEHDAMTAGQQRSFDLT